MYAQAFSEPSQKITWISPETVDVSTFVQFESGSWVFKKYNSFGDLVQVLGTPGKKGTGLNPLQFDNPAELHVDDTGDIYIVDGDGGLNNRLIKLSQGTWLSFVWWSKSIAQLVGSHLSDTEQSFGQRLCLHIAFSVCPCIFTPPLSLIRALVTGSTLNP